MSETDLISIGDALPVLASVTVGNGPYVVIVEWAEGSRAGTSEAIDLASVILTYKTFRPLRDDPALFATVRLSEYGDAIDWGRDDSLAVSGATLERLAEEVMTPAKFSEFMKRNKLTLDATAAQLGISRRMAAYYAKERDVPRYIALACKQLEQEMSPLPQGTVVSAPMRFAGGPDNAIPFGAPYHRPANGDLAFIQGAARDLAEGLLRAGSVRDAYALQEAFVSSTMARLEALNRSVGEVAIRPPMPSAMRE